MSGHISEEEAVCGPPISMRSQVSFLDTSFATYYDTNNNCTIRSSFSNQSILGGKAFKAVKGSWTEAQKHCLLLHQGFKSICSFSDNKTHMNPQGAGGPQQKTHVQYRWLPCHSVLKCQVVAYLSSSTHLGPGCPGRTGTPRSPQPSW